MGPGRKRRRRRMERRDQKEGRRENSWGTRKRRKGMKSVPENLRHRLQRTEVEAGSEKSKLKY